MSGSLAGGAAPGLRKAHRVLRAQASSGIRGSGDPTRKNAIGLYVYNYCSLRRGVRTGRWTWISKQLRDTPGRSCKIRTTLGGCYWSDLIAGMDAARDWSGSKTREGTAFSPDRSKRQQHSRPDRARSACRARSTDRANVPDPVPAVMWRAEVGFRVGVKNVGRRRAPAFSPMTTSLHPHTRSWGSLPAPTLRTVSLWSHLSRMCSPG